MIYFIYFILALLVGAIGANKPSLGFWGAFILSLLLSPLIGLFIVALSKDKQVIIPPAPKPSAIDELYKATELHKAGHITDAQLTEIKTTLGMQALAAETEEEKAAKHSRLMSDWDTINKAKQAKVDDFVTWLKILLVIIIGIAMLYGINKLVSLFNEKPIEIKHKTPQATSLIYDLPTILNGNATKAKKILTEYTESNTSTDNTKTIYHCKQDYCIEIEYNTKTDNIISAYYSCSPPTSNYDKLLTSGNLKNSTWLVLQPEFSPNDVTLYVGVNIKYK